MLASFFCCCDSSCCTLYDQYKYDLILSPNPPIPISAALPYPSDSIGKFYYDGINHIHFDTLEELFSYNAGIYFRKFAEPSTAVSYNMINGTFYNNPQLLTEEGCASVPISTFYKYIVDAHNYLQYEVFHIDYARRSPFHA